MAKLPTKQQVNVRLPVELVEWVATQAGSQTDVITAALLNLRDGPVIVDEADADQVATLQAEIDALRADASRLKHELASERSKPKPIALAAVRAVHRAAEPSSDKPVAAVLPAVERFEARPIGSLLKGAKAKKGRNNAQDQAAGGEDA